MPIAYVLCRYGYSSASQLSRVLDSYAYFQIPLETFVTDSQYMDHDQDFTMSPDFEPFDVNFPSKHPRRGARLM